MRVLWIPMLIIGCSTPPQPSRVPEGEETTAPKSEETLGGEEQPAPSDPALFLARHYTGEAERLLDLGQNREALDMARRAERLAPEDREVHRVARRIERVMGVRHWTQSALQADAEAKSRIREQMMRALIAEEVEKGRKALANDDPETARRHFENALILERRYGLARS